MEISEEAMLNCLEIDMNDGQWHLKDEIKEWIENIGGRIVENGGRVSVVLPNEAAKLLFKLPWL